MAAVPAGFICSAEELRSLYIEPRRASKPDGDSPCPDFRIGSAVEVARTVVLLPCFSMFSTFRKEATNRLDLNIRSLVS